MTAETDLLPLPGDHCGSDDYPRYDAEQVRACVSSVTEALRAEVERLTGCLSTANANHETFERRWYLEQDRAERLAEALREAADMLLADYPETAKRLRAALHPTAAQEGKE